METLHEQRLSRLRCLEMPIAGPLLTPTKRDQSPIRGHPYGRRGLPLSGGQILLVVRFGAIPALRIEETQAGKARRMALTVIPGRVDH
jgi:hypothetical protein